MKMRKKIKCPKCGGAPVEYVELWQGASITFDAKTFESFSGGDYGDPYCVQATCGCCGHIWRLHGITQITEIKNIYGVENADIAGE
jgi:hypothetical protein